MRESGSKVRILGMEEEYRYGKMDRGMKDIGGIIELVVEEG